MSTWPPNMGYAAPPWNALHYRPIINPDRFGVFATRAVQRNPWAPKPPTTRPAPYRKMRGRRGRLQAERKRRLEKDDPRATTGLGPIMFAYYENKYQAEEGISTERRGRRGRLRKK